MELKELNKEELMAISGGNELTEGLLYVAGVIAKGIYNYAKAAQEGGYAYAKCGM